MARHGRVLTMRRSLSSLKVLGPLRAKADFHWALEPQSSGVNVVGGPLNRAWEHVKGLRPRLTEAQYGFDFAAPGSGGAVRIGGWYTPSRREGLVEMRLF